MGVAGGGSTRFTRHQCAGAQGAYGTDWRAVDVRVSAALPVWGAADSCTARATMSPGELLDRFGLTDAGGRTVKTYSGGMRRRLDLAVSLVARPPVLFLDEPTTGLDPRSRTDLWELIEELVGDGTTLLLTTQYLEAADRLADRIAVIDHGRVIARGTAAELKSELGRWWRSASPMRPPPTAPPRSCARTARSPEVPTTATGCS